MPDEKPKKHNLLGTFVIASIAYIVLGIFMVVKSESFAEVINVIFGVAMLLYGIINVIAFFLNHDNTENLFMELALGVIAIGLGIFSLVTSRDIARILFYAIGDRLSALEHAADPRRRRHCHGRAVHRPLRLF